MIYIFIELMVHGENLSYTENIIKIINKNCYFLGPISTYY